MAALIFLLLSLGGSIFKSKSRLEAENAALRQQLIVLQRKIRGRVQFTNSDRLFFIQLYRWFTSVLNAITTFRSETLVRWHRAGFRRYWRWKSRNLEGRPQISADLRALIRRMRTGLEDDVRPSCRLPLSATAGDEVTLTCSGAVPPPVGGLSPRLEGVNTTPPE